MNKVALLILDGWGLNDDPDVSAIAAASTPYMDRLLSQHPSSTLITYGEDVGLPSGQMGNSEVGHLNIGAGRTVFQELTRIDRDIRLGILEENPELTRFLGQAQKTGRLHLMGLLSDGGVHSHIDHLLELCRIASSWNIEQVMIHAFLDGRDTSPRGGLAYTQSLLDHIAELPGVDLASIIGRYYAMDRDNRWPRIKKAFDLLVHGKAEITSNNPIESIAECYEQDLTDEFMPPISILPEGGRIAAGDSVLFFNFRSDRPRQLTQVLTQKSQGDMSPLDIHMATLTEYDTDFEGLSIIYPKATLPQTLGEVLSLHGKTQLRIAETEKYPHVTYFFSGGQEEAFRGESRRLVDSPKVATYDLQPEMSAKEICNSLLEYVSDSHPDFICLNFANTDMVGHTGVFDAAKKAAETVDTLVRRIVDTLDAEYQFVIIADHGNSDQMIHADGSPHTAHTTNPVPLIVLSPKVSSVSQGTLADIAPTVLSLMDLPIPAEMTGKVLCLSNTKTTR